MYGDFETHSSLNMLFHNAMWTKRTDAKKPICFSKHVLQIVQVKKRAYDRFCKENIINCNQLSKTIIIGLAYSIIYQICTAKDVVYVIRRRSNTHCMTEISPTAV